MKPDLSFFPASGSALEAGPVSVAWTAPWSGASMIVLVGTVPGDGDVDAVSVAAGSPIAFTFPSDARRVFLSCWLTGPSEGPVAYSISFWLADPDIAPETSIRRIVGTYWLESWLGENLDERRLCPACVLGFAGEEITFDPENAADVAPWTPAEVRGGVGFALLRLRELDRFDTGLSAGGVGAVVVSEDYRLYGLDFEIAIPSKLKGGDPIELVERRTAEIERLFCGLDVLPDGTSVVSIRNLARYPTRRRVGTDDGVWRRTFITVQIRARVRTPHVGPREVALP